MYGDEIHAFVLADVVNGDDVRMIQRGCGFRFLHEPPAALDADRRLAAKHFHGDRTAETLSIARYCNCVLHRAARRVRSGKRSCGYHRPGPAVTSAQPPRPCQR